MYCIVLRCAAVRVAYSLVCDGNVKTETADASDKLSTTSGGPSLDMYINSVGLSLVTRLTSISSPVPSTQPGVLITKGHEGNLDNRFL